MIHKKFRGNIRSVVDVVVRFQEKEVLLTSLVGTGREIEGPNFGFTLFRKVMHLNITIQHTEYILASHSEKEQSFNEEGEQT